MTVAALFSAAVMIVILFGQHLPVWSIYALLFLFGFAAGGQVIVFAVGKELGQAKMAGSSIAFTNFTVMLGGVFLQPILGYILQGTEQNYHDALIILPICLVVSALLSQFALKETFCKPIENNEKVKTGIRALAS